MITHHRQVKILRIKLRNLNSLRGEHIIDFTREPLASASIFAITGPTGAGKSTLLDAMTLALFGQAARYQNDRNPENMMSRHSSDCLAEVMFSVNQETYRAEWQLRRAKGKVDGKIQPPVRFLYDAQEKPMNRLATECTQEIERITGLNYQRFLRSVLLAQGEFSRFLKATADERAELLESLTGTEIYSEIGILAHEEYGRRDTALSTIRAELAHYQLLSEEEINETEQSITTINVQLTEAKIQHASRQQRLLLGEELQKNNQARQLQMERKDLLNTEKIAKQAWLKQLALHQLALPYSTSLQEWERTKENSYSTSLAATASTTLTADARDACIEQVLNVLKLTESQYTERNQKLFTIRSAIAETEKQSSIIQKWLAEHQHLAELESTLPSLNLLAQELHVHHRHHAQLTQDLSHIESEIHTWKQQITTAKNALDLSQSAHEHSITTLTQHQAFLRSHLSPWPGLDAESALERSRQEQQQLRDLIAIRQTILTLTHELDSVKNSVTTLLAKQENEQLGLTNAQALLARHEHELKLKRDHLRLAERVASLEDQRAALHDGDTCPLCGSLDHPLRKADCPAPDFSHIQQALLQAESQWRASEQSVLSWQKLAIATQTNRSHAQQTLSEKQQAIAQAQNHSATLFAVLTLPQDTGTDLNNHLLQSTKQEQELKVAHKNVIDAEQKSRDAQYALAQAQQKFKDLTQRLDEYEIQREKKSTVQLELDTKIIDLTQNLTKSIEPFQLNLPDFTATLLSLDAWQKSSQHFPRGTQKLADFHNALEKQRIEEMHLDKEINTLREGTAQLRQQLTHELSFAELAIKEALAKRPSSQEDLPQLQRASDQARTRLERATAESAMLTTQAQQAQLTCQVAEKQLLENLTASPFPDLPSLRAALLSEDELDSRREWLLEWERREQLRLALLGAAEQRLAELTSLHAPDEETYAKLSIEAAAQEEIMLAIAKEHTLLEEKLRRNAAQRKAYVLRSADSEQQLKELEIWQIMRGLIGSHDGAKFRKFAQGVSLDILTHHANKHLQQLSERYRLQRQDHVDLTLEIIDQFQANCTRPMSSLSGGESFLVSLALALGLSDLAGRNVRIDSLFIDEGFGSLDADALDAAISTLESLHQQNKTIGVISHIDLVKERIHTKINVRRLSAGSSTLDVA